jgi:hypothetical protein
MYPGKDASNHVKLGTAFLYSAAICLHYRQIGSAKSVVNYRMSKLLKPAFAARTQCSKVGALQPRAQEYSTQWDWQLTQLVAHTIGLAALLEDGLVLEFLVIERPAGTSLFQHYQYSFSGYEQ